MHLPSPARLTQTHSTPGCGRTRLCPTRFAKVSAPLSGSPAGSTTAAPGLRRSASARNASTRASPAWRRPPLSVTRDAASTPWPPAAIALRAASRPASASSALATGSPAPDAASHDQRRTRRGVLLDRCACRTVQATCPVRRISVVPPQADSAPRSSTPSWHFSATSSALSAHPGTAPAVTEEMPPPVDSPPLRQQDSLRVGPGVGDGDCSRSQDRHRSPTTR